ncbi:MAG: N-glycosylase/DNA lyase [bacterium]
MDLTEDLKASYLLWADRIQSKLREFTEIPRELYFYELCFCICTPQSKAASAMLVQNQLMKIDFLNNDIDPIEILLAPSNYIRFHNQKAINLCRIKAQWNTISGILYSDLSNVEKRNWLAKNVRGIGYKESAHFLRNIGYRDLAILDRHILRNLVSCGVFNEIPKISSANQYFVVEKKFAEFAGKMNMTMDELDLLFWSKMTGCIIK